MDLVIETLVVDEHRIAHIARHQVTIEEVREVVSGDYAYIQGREHRWLLIGQTRQGRFLTVVVGERSQPNTYGLVTARPASREERSFYRELALEQGGEQDDQSSTTKTGSYPHSAFRDHRGGGGVLGQPLSG